MSITYTPSTNFGAKDSLPTNDSNKVIRGSEFTTEFVAIQTAFSNAAPAASPTFTGTVTISSVDINGGTIDGVTIGGSSAGAGSFTTLTASGDVNFDSGTLFVDASADAVGIGTTSPSFTAGNKGIHIADATSPAIRLQDTNNANSDFTIYSPDGDNSLRIYHENNATDYVSITSEGDVGIGTTSPSGNLHVDGGEVFFTSTGNSKLQIKAGNTSSSFIEFGDPDDGNVGRLLYGHSDNSMQFTVNASEAMRIDSSGHVLVGGTTGLGPASAVKKIEIQGTGATDKAYFLNYTTSYSYSGIYNAGDSNTYNFWKSGNNYLFGTVTDPDTTGFSEAMRIDSSGNVLVGTTTNDPADNNDASGIELQAAGQIQASATSARVIAVNRKSTDGEIINFRKDGTTVGSIGTRTSRLYFAQTGGSGIAMSGVNLLPTDGDGIPNDNANDIGFSSFRFDDIYATNATIQTSDANEKQDIEELSEAERRVAVAAKSLLRKFRWISSVDEKGDEARIHFGIIAQDLQAAFEAEGLDAGRYAMFIHSTWTDEETGEERSRMGVRYSELLAFIIAAL